MILQRTFFRIIFVRISAKEDFLGLLVSRSVVEIKAFKRRQQRQCVTADVVGLIGLFLLKYIISRRQAVWGERQSISFCLSTEIENDFFASLWHFISCNSSHLLFETLRLFKACFFALLFRIYWLFFSTEPISENVHDLIPTVLQGATAENLLKTFFSWKENSSSFQITWIGTF